MCHCASDQDVNTAKKLLANLAVGLAAAERVLTVRGHRLHPDRDQGGEWWPSLEADSWSASAARALKNVRVALSNDEGNFDGLRIGGEKHELSEEGRRIAQRCLFRDNVVRALTLLSFFFFFRLRTPHGGYRNNHQSGMEEAVRMIMRSLRSPV